MKFGTAAEEKAKAAPWKAKSAAPSTYTGGLGKTDTIGPVFTHESAALAIFDGYGAFFVARVPGMCFGLCAAGPRIGNIVTCGSLCA